MTWLWTRPGRPTGRSARSPRPASTSGGLVEALDGHDRKLGLGFSGPIISAFHSICQAAFTPENGSARFEVTLDSKGQVLSVRVISADGNRARWAAVARSALHALRSRAFRVPAAGQGIEIVLEVRSRVQLPSGAKPGDAARALVLDGKFDLSDIGATSMHNVAVHVVTERRR